MKRQRGFTLLELIIVIGIFGVFSAMAYGGLNTVLSTRAKIESNLARTEEYDRAYLRLRTDLQNAAPRPIRDGNGEQQPAFGYDSFAQKVEFTRAGWQNLLSLPRPTLERVSYSLEESASGDKARGSRFQEKQLVRRSWHVLDRASQTKPVEVILLDRVQTLEWQFFDSTGQRSESWPASSGTPLAPGSTYPPPTAVEITVTTQDWGELRMMFRVGAEGASRYAELSKPPPPPPPGAGQPGDPSNPGGGNPGGGNKPPPPPDDDGNPTQ